MRGTRNLTEARAIYIDETQVVVDAEGNVDYAGSTATFAFLVYFNP